MKTIDFDEILSLPHSLNINDKRLGNNPIVLYGAAVGGEYCLKYLQHFNIKPVAICDTFKAGQDFCGYKICSIEDILNKYENPKIIITSVRFYEDIKNKLLEYFDEDSLLSFVSEMSFEKINRYKDFIQNNKMELNNIYNMFEDEKSKETLINVLKGRATADNKWTIQAYTQNQYFSNDVITLTDNESFIDGGAYVGDTAEMFLKETNNHYKKIFCFEPSENTYLELMGAKKNHNDDERIVLFKAGLYSKNAKLGFDEKSLSPGNAVNEKSSDISSIDVVSIDNVINEEVTFIKMDIEGSELDALKGARETILKYKPKLAICVYHKNEDIIEIPNYIMSLGLDYKFYLRHHSPYDFFETVFYAI